MDINEAKTYIFMGVQIFIVILLFPQNACCRNLTVPCRVSFVL